MSLNLYIIDFRGHYVDIDEIESLVVIAETPEAALDLAYADSKWMPPRPFARVELVEIREPQIVLTSIR